MSQIDVNDDSMGTNYYYSAVQIWLESGTTIYIQMDEPYSTGDQFYSIFITTAGFGGSSAGTSGAPDAYETDDTSGAATVLVLDVVQDHSFAPAGPGGDEDWFVFTAP